MAVSFVGILFPGYVIRQDRLVASFHLTFVEYSRSASSRDLEVLLQLHSSTRFNIRCTLESSVWISTQHVMLMVVPFYFSSILMSYQYPLTLIVIVRILIKSQ